MSQAFIDLFEDPERAKSYGDGPKRFTPGLSDVYKMVGVLIRERSSPQARLLVHGAGGGLEIEAFADANPGWTFLGVDPAKAMLDAAEARLAASMHKVAFHHGLIDSAPAGPFDAATSLLTLHFLSVEDRIQTMRDILKRLRPGSPFVVVHSSFPQAEPDRERWLDRYEAFAIASGVDRETANGARLAVSAMSTIYEPVQDQDMLRAAGFLDVSQFYSAFTWSGFVGYAP